MSSTPAFCSSAYWDTRYRHGGASGAGSVGRLARFKAAVVNRFIDANAVCSVIDLGCGDGSQLALLHPPADYIGLDVSPTALAKCSEQFPNRRFLPYQHSLSLPPAELSLDVLYHLIEDAEFVTMTRLLFALASRFVLIYASNVDAAWPAPHVRHRAFTQHVAATEPSWRLLAHLPNPFPYDPARPNDTSFADFFIYGRTGSDCVVDIPATG